MTAAPTARTPRGPRGRPQSISDNELRERMFAAASDMLSEVGGFSLNFEHLNLERIMRRADVSRSAVYRVWGTRDEFNFDLLKAFASSGTGGFRLFDSHTREIARDVVREMDDLLGTVEGRRAVMLEAIRRATAANFTTILDTRSWRRYAVLTVSADSMTSAEDPVEQARGQEILGCMRETERAFDAEATAFYQGMFELLRLRPKPPYTMDTVFEVLAHTAVALFQGLALQHTVNPELATTDYDGPGGAWTLPAQTFLAILDMVSENAED